jgi:hypothetical protein
VVWWPWLLLAAMMCIAGAFLAQAGSSHQAAARGRARAWDVAQLGIGGAMDRKPLLRRSGSAEALAAEAKGEREERLALAVALVGLLGALGSTGAGVRRHRRRRSAGWSCPLCSPPQPPGRWAMLGLAWRRAEPPLVLLAGLLLVGVGAIAVADLVGGAALSGNLVDRVTTQSLETLQFILPVGLLPG